MTEALIKEKYQNKYRTWSSRLQSWNYTWNAAYFITVCTKNRKPFFGDVLNGNMVLSEIGGIVEKYWYEIPRHFPFVKLGAFTVMPNHIHGIIIINRDMPQPSVETPKLDVSTTMENGYGGKNKNWQPGSLGTIVNQYKRICTINARKINPDWSWQSRFYDHIIRNDKSFGKITRYIKNNPSNWHKDKFSR